LHKASAGLFHGRAVERLAGARRGEVQGAAGPRQGCNRRERRYGPATSNIARLVVLGGSGSLSLDAVRWLADVGASLVCIDRDGALTAVVQPTEVDR
jgi:hypothetical protein